MEVLLKRYFWVVKALGLAISMALLGSAVSTQLGTQLLLAPAVGGELTPPPKDGDAEAGKKAKPRRPRSAANRRQIATKIQERNIFCPTCRPVEVQVSPDGKPMPTGPGNAGEVATSLPLRLMATMESTDPAYSLATILDNDSGVAGLYAQGDTVLDGVTVTSVGRGVVHLKNKASLEYLEIGPNDNKGKPKKKKEEKKEKKNTKKKKNSREIEGASEAINCSGDSCTVEREFVEKLLANPAMLAKQARVVPAIKNGSTEGFKFYGIRRGSLPRLLGLKNGDLIKSINGEELDSMDKAMKLYTKLRRASNLTITLERKGKAVNKEIQIK